MPKQLSRKGWVRKLDKICSEIVRKRDPACVICGSVENLQAGHLFSRRHYSTRWNIDQIFTQCASCNFQHNSNAWPYIRWFIKKFGQKKLDEIEALYQQVTHFKDSDLEEIYRVLVEVACSSQGKKVTRVSSSLS